MKKYIPIIVLLCGCASMTTEIDTIDQVTGKVVSTKKTKVSSFFSGSTVEGLIAGKEAKTTSSLLEVKQSGTTSEIEKLAPLFEAAVAGAVKGAK